MSESDHGDEFRSKRMELVREAAARALARLEAERIVEKMRAASATKAASRAQDDRSGREMRSGRGDH